jgi:hypothetical protein
MSEQEESAGRSIGLMLVVGAAAVVLLLVVGLGAFGLVGTTTVTVEESGVIEPTDEGPIVVDRFARGGFEVFGITFDQPDRTLNVLFFAPAECAEGLPDEAVWPDDTDCDVHRDVHGIVRGGGLAEDGRALVNLDIEVGAECFANSTVGEVYSVETPGCGD